MYIIKVRKLPEVIKDKLFDICYEIIWVKKWILSAFICIGLFCFYLAYYRYQTMLSWLDVPPLDELQQVNGRLLEFEYNEGGAYKRT